MVLLGVDGNFARDDMRKGRGREESGVGNAKVQGQGVKQKISAKQGWVATLRWSHASHLGCLGSVLAVCTRCRRQHMEGVIVSSQSFLGLRMIDQSFPILTFYSMVLQHRGLHIPSPTPYASVLTAQPIFELPANKHPIQFLFLVSSGGLCGCSTYR